MSNQEQLQQATGEAGAEFCPACEHDLHEGECEHELGDTEIDGILVAQGPCGCTAGKGKP